MASLGTRELEDISGSPAKVDPYLRLLAAILVKSYTDLFSRSFDEQLSATLYLLSPDAEQTTDLLGLGSDPLAPIRGGRVDEILKIHSRWRKGK